MSIATWVLIITIINHSPSSARPDNATSIVIDDFKSQQSCEREGEAYKAHIYKATSGKTYPITHCLNKE